MADPESCQRLTPSAQRGPTMHAVEGMVLGIFAVAWVFSPLRNAVAPVPLLDLLIVLPVGVSACLNLLLCTIMPSNEPVQAGFFAVTLTGFLGYLCVAIEAQTSGRYAAVFLGGGFLFQIPAGISLALLAVQGLLAAGAVSHRLWRLTQWQEGSLLLLAGLLCWLCLQQQIYVEWAVALLVVAALATASVLSAAGDAPRWARAHLGVYASLALLSDVLAYVAGVTVWAHLTMTTSLWLLILYRVVAPGKRPASLVPTAVVVADAQPLMPPSLNRRVFYVPPPVALQPSAARVHGDAVLFGGRPILLRTDGPVKKHI